VLLFLLVVFLTFLLLVFAAAIGTEFKSVACLITGTMLHLEIQEDREGMKDKRLNKDLGTTAGCTVRLKEACSTSTSIKGDAWLAAVSELAICGFEAVLQVKQNHGLYPEKVIEDALKESPGGYILSLKAPSMKTQC
jgi:hypothetical protein